MEQEGKVLRYDAGELIFEEGAPGSDFFIIMSGAVLIRKHINHERVDIATLKSGDFFGENSVVDRQPRSAAAYAGEDGAVLMSVDAARFVYLVSQQPAFALLVLEILSRRQRGAGPAPPGERPLLSSALAARPPYEAVSLGRGAWQLKSNRRTCNAYLFKGSQRTVLFDTGLPSAVNELRALLGEIDVAVDDIDLIVLTHEHFDHTAAVPLLGSAASVAAHRLAANKIVLRDEFATLSRAFGEAAPNFKVDVEIGEGSTIDTGDHRFRSLHTPGHSSGSVSFIEQETGLLVCGDTLMAGGPLGGIFGSGNVSDLIYSLAALRALRPALSLPGHGPVSKDPLRDIDVTRERCESLLSESRALFDALDGNESVNRILNSYKDINRSWNRQDAARSG